MNKKVIYGGICAATLVITAAISVISCNTTSNGGCPVYVQGPEQRASLNVELNIESYREPDGYIGNYWLTR